MKLVHDMTAPRCPGLNGSPGLVGRRQGVSGQPGVPPYFATSDANSVSCGLGVDGVVDVSMS